LATIGPGFGGGWTGGGCTGGGCTGGGFGGAAARGGGGGWRGGAGGEVAGRGGGGAARQSGAAGAAGAAGSLPRPRGGAVRQSASLVPGELAPLGDGSSAAGSRLIFAVGRGGFQPAGFWCHGLNGGCSAGTFGSVGRIGTICPTEPVVCPGGLWPSTRITCRQALFLQRIRLPIMEPSR
jgi:hypothetical protein